MSSLHHTVVVGGGISGLGVAYWLKNAGHHVTVLEREPEAGGTMRTLRQDGWLVEIGPNSALETTPLFEEMFQGLGLTPQRIYANPASDKRYILRGGELHPLPMSPAAFVRSRLWTVSGKIRLLGEPFVGRAAGEESIARFVTRRLGREFLDYAINPFVAGVYAGNPEELSVRAAFPKLYALEEKYGGLIRGMVLGARERKRRAEKAKDRARMFAFASGMQSFPDALGRFLRGSFQGGCTVSAVQPPAAGRQGTVRFSRQGVEQTIACDAIVLSVPAAAAAKLIRPVHAPAADLLEGIVYPPVSEVFLGYRTSAFQRPLDGFGYLIPGCEGRRILGTIWSSSIFPDRAPGGHVALTTFVGGARQPAIARLEDDQLVETVKEEIRQIMGASEQPVYAHVSRWEQAIPQYHLGYSRVLDALDALEGAHAGLYFCSNYRGGIAVGDCVMNGKKTADRILERVALTSSTQ